MKLLSSPITAFELDLPVTAGESAVAIMEAALLAVDPAEAVKRALLLQQNTLQLGAMSYDLDGYEHIYVVGAGKASAAMARALEDILGGRITAGWINVKDGYTAPTRTITIHEAGHPVPDERSVEGSRK